MTPSSKTNRIWELDALRGVAILAVVVLHFLYDLQVFLGLSLVNHPVIYAVMQYGGVIFVVLSGLCVTLGHHSFRRGLLVFSCGMIITAVTVAMVWLGMAHETMIIRFGVLHLLGICMMLWPFFQKLPLWGWITAGIAMVALGYWFQGLRVEARWLYPLGLIYGGFASSDFFPLLPNLGWFLLGAALGRTAYGRKQTLLPRFPAEAVPIRFFRWCGTHSLWIYLAHQPIIYGALELVFLIRG